MFQLIFLCTYSFDIFHRGVHRKLYNIRGRFDSKIIYFDISIGVLVVRKVQKVLLLLIQPDIQTIGSHRLDVFYQDLNRKSNVVHE